MPRSRGQSRRFVVRTYVTATCAAEALRKARRTMPDDVVSLDSEKDGQATTHRVDAVGFRVDPADDEYD